MKKQRGFSLIEVLLILLLVSFLTFAGYFVWSKNKKAEEKPVASTTQKVTTPQTPTTPIPATTASTLTETDKAAQQWKLVNSGQGGFSVRIPDGWKLTSITSNDSLYGQSVNYMPGTPATIDTTKDYGGDEQFRISIYQLPNGQVATPTNTTTFKTLSGESGLKSHSTSPVEPCGGAGCTPGFDIYTYEFKKNEKTTIVSYLVYNYNQYSKDVFGITTSDKNQENLVDSLAKTLVIK